MVLKCTYQYKFTQFVHTLVPTRILNSEISWFCFDFPKWGTVSFIITDFNVFVGIMSLLRHSILRQSLLRHLFTAGNRHKQNSWFCKEIREDNFRFWWRRVHEDASQGMYMSKIEIFFFTARILQNQRMLCCGECFHD
jgi:hypothetical protein